MPLRYDRRILLLTIAAGLPGTVVAVVLLWTGGYSLQTTLTIVLAILVAWSIAASSIRHRIVFPLHTMANLLEALRENDFSFRARGERIRSARRFSRLTPLPTRCVMSVSDRWKPVRCSGR